MLIPFPDLFARWNIKVDGVLHLGANLGQEAEAYAAQGISRVIWVEAIPDIYAQLVRKIARFPGSIALRACLSDTDGDQVTFNVANNEGQSSSMLKFGTHAQAHPSVKFTSKVSFYTVRLDTLLKQNGLSLGPGWFLNIDVQGAELLVLKGMGRQLTQFDHVYIEVNTDHLYQGCPLIGEIDTYLADFDFVRKETKMTPQRWGDAYYRRNTLPA